MLAIVGLAEQRVTIYDAKGKILQAPVTTGATGLETPAALIVSDEGAHIETGKDTDFVVLPSGEPQGGIKSRRREFEARPRGDGYFGLPFGFRLF